MVFVQVVVGLLAFGARLLDVRRTVRAHGKELGRAVLKGVAFCGKLGGVAGCPGLVSP